MVEAMGSVPRCADVVVVGAGLAGLAATRRLVAEGLQVALVESGDAPGGRVRTDVLDGVFISPESGAGFAGFSCVGYAGQGTGFFAVRGAFLGVQCLDLLGWVRSEQAACSGPSRRAELVHLLWDRGTLVCQR